jgi:hypothetical protein
MAWEELADPLAPTFSDSLNRLLPLVTASTAESFYAVLVGHLLGDAPSATHRLLLQAICRTFASGENTAAFISGGFHKRLPYSKPACGPGILDVLYFLVRHSPSVLSSALLRRLPDYARRAPSKVLTLFALAFDADGTAARFADFLLEHGAAFRAPRAIESYVALLVHAGAAAPEAFAARAGDAVVECLSAEFDEVLVLCYNALCALHEAGCAARVPCATLAAHLARDYVRGSVISYLLRVPPQGGADWPLLERLLAIARQSVPAVYVLLQAAASPAAAALLAAHGEWLALPLPHVRFTLNLFCRVFLHAKLRRRLTQHEKELAQLLLTVSALTNERGKPDASAIQVSCLILRRVEVTGSLLAALGEVGFLRVFFDAARECGEELRALIILRQFAKVGRFRGIVALCEFVIANLKGRNEVTAKAAVAAANAMCEYEKCVEKFKEDAGLAEILTKRRRTMGGFDVFLKRLQ